MVLLDCEEFLMELTKMIQEDSTNKSKSLWITYKRYIPNTRTWKHKKDIETIIEEDPVCLIRAKIGKKKISTHVPNSICENFSAAINHISDSMITHQIS
uniref:Signal recognition particle 14 kDa protein n=1 Tax=Theileria annulata TaxID=5874 RepID=A0A3B0MSF6_THEAN